MPYAETQEFETELVSCANIQAPNGWRRLLTAVRTRSFCALPDQILVSAANFLMLVSVARLTSVAELGTFVLALRTVDFFVELLNVWIWAPFTLFVPAFVDSGRRRYEGSVLIQQLAAMLISMCLVAMFAAVALSFHHNAALAKLVFFAIPAGGCILMREFVRRFSFAALAAQHALAVDAGVFALQLAGVGLLWKLHAVSAAGVLCVTGVACLTGAGGYLIWARKRFEFDRACIHSGFKRNFSYGRWLFGSDFALLISNQLYPWLIAGIAGNAVLGVFAACQAIVNFARMFLISAQNALLPRTAHVWATGDLTLLNRLVRRSTLFLSGGAGLFCIVIFFGHRLILGLVYGTRFVQSGNLIFLLALALLATAATLAPTFALSASGRAVVNLFVNCIALLVHLTAGVLLVIRFGALGAAYGLILGGSLAAAMRYVIYRELFVRRPRFVAQEAA